MNPFGQIEIVEATHQHIVVQSRSKFWIRWVFAGAAFMCLLWIFLGVDASPSGRVLWSAVILGGSAFSVRKSGDRKVSMNRETGKATVEDETWTTTRSWSFPLDQIVQVTMSSQDESKVVSLQLADESRLNLGTTYFSFSRKREVADQIQSWLQAA